MRRNNPQIHPTNSTPTAATQSNYEWLKSQMPEVLRFVKNAAEKSVVDLGMMSAAFDSSSESANRFTYAMYAAGATYMVCDILEKYPQMQSLGGTFEEAWSNILKDSRENIASAALAAIGVAGTIALSQTSPDKAEGSDIYKQIPAAVIAGAMSFLYMQSSKAIERVSAEKRTELHEREVAQPFEQEMSNVIQILTGQPPQVQQGQNTFVSQLRTAAQNTKSELDNAMQKIDGLRGTIVEKEKNISELNREKDVLLERNETLSVDNLLKAQIIAEKDKETAAMKTRKESWQEKVSRGLGERPRGNSI